MQHKSTTIFLQSCHFAITCEFMGETAISRETPATVNKRNHSISSSVVKEKHLVPKISQFCVLFFFFVKKEQEGSLVWSQGTIRARLQHLHICNPQVTPLQIKSTIIVHVYLQILYTSTVYSEKKIFYTEQLLCKCYISYTCWIKNICKIQSSYNKTRAIKWNSWLYDVHPYQIKRNKHQILSI